MTSAALPRTGDHVFVRPINETWLVAYVEDNGKFLACCGWPFSMIEVSHCDVVYRATDEEHEKLVDELASMSEDDPRRRWARRQRPPRASSEDEKHG